MHVFGVCACLTFYMFVHVFVYMFVYTLASLVYMFVYTPASLVCMFVDFCVHTCSLVMADAAVRFRRVVNGKNPILIKLAASQILPDVCKMSPFDLVNTLKITPSNSTRLVNAIVNEAYTRQYRQFNGTDFTIFFTALLRKRVTLEQIPHLPMSRMNTSDLVTCVWAITKLHAKTQNHIEQLVCEFLQNQNRFTELTPTNICQLLFIAPMTTGFLDSLYVAAAGQLPRCDDSAVVYIAFSVSKLHSRFLHFPPSLVTLCERLNEHIQASTTMSDMQIVDCVRGLGRLRLLKKTLVDSRLPPILARTKLDDKKLSGIKNACVSVGFTDYRNN